MFIRWLKNLFKGTKDCLVCDNPGMYRHSICDKCGYYQRSCMSPRAYKYLKAEGKLYSKISDSNEFLRQ